MSTSTAPEAARPLFGRTRSALLARLYGHPDEAFHFRRLARDSGTGLGAAQRELKLLTNIGIVQRRQQGNQVLYQANSQSPIFRELRSLIAKTVGVGDVLRSAL